MKIDPNEVIHSIIMLDQIRAIERRIGKEEAACLSEHDLALAKEEVRAAIEHHLDEREFIEIGLDAWEITRNL